MAEWAAAYEKGGGEYRTARIKRANSAIGARGKAGRGFLLAGGIKRRGEANLRVLGWAAGDYTYRGAILGQK